jgi:hypothetical protein
VNVETWVNPDSDLCSDAFVDDFQNRLLLHHAISEEPLKKKTFEYAFRESNISAKRDARIEQNPVLRGADVLVNGVRYSCKTEASKTLSDRYIKISKLLEARWIRECNTGEDFAQKTREMVAGHLCGYDRIVVLRAFVRRADLIQYRLTEIPRDLLLLIRNVRAEDFSARTSNGSTSAELRSGDLFAFRLRLDGSVEKVTIERLNENLCVKHAEFSIPVKQQ